MSVIRVRNGSATAELDSMYDRLDKYGVNPSYNPHDLMDATAAALLAVNTPQAIRWAGEIYRIANGETE
ncbi:MAG: hypothetical protein JWO67_2224 [Streptosporangiaceae bacterium]|nr:hypothetical protein [Streptosporangiaceae bacterium]